MYVCVRVPYQSLPGASFFFKRTIRKQCKAFAGIFLRPVTHYTRFAPDTALHVEPATPVLAYCPQPVCICSFRRLQMVDVRKSFCAHFFYGQAFNLSIKWIKLFLQDGQRNP
jgi:hypothetical protein